VFDGCTGRCDECDPERKPFFPPIRDRHGGGFQAAESGIGDREIVVRLVDENLSDGYGIGPVVAQAENDLVLVQNGSLHRDRFDGRYLSQASDRVEHQE
jgi:hypothetical protein